MKTLTTIKNFLVNMTIAPLAIIGLLISLLILRFQTRGEE